MKKPQLPNLKNRSLCRIPSIISRKVGTEVRLMSKVKSLKCINHKAKSKNKRLPKWEQPLRIYKAIQKQKKLFRCNKGFNHLKVPALSPNKNPTKLLYCQNQTSLRKQQIQKIKLLTKHKIFKQHKTEEIRSILLPDKSLVKI